MQAYAYKTGQILGHLRFTFEGMWVGYDHTPAELEMEEGDVVNVALQMTGD
jgi:hypothetical protein